ncbi:MAG: hypothetical protein ABUK11_05605 [Mariprofundaceae bacterium]
MTQIKDIRIGLPHPPHALPQQRGLFDHFPKIGELQKAYGALTNAGSDEERFRARGEVGALLKRMAGVYHPSQPELISLCRSHAGAMNDANLEKAITVCEVAFHGQHANSDKPDYETLLEIAGDALVFVMALLRHKLVRHEDAFTDLHGPFFHFAHCVLTCRQQLGERASKVLMGQAAGNIAAFILLGRMDFFSMSAARQKALMRTLNPILSTCDIYFIPAGETIDEVGGFWVTREDDRLSAGRSKLHKALSGSTTHARLVTSILPLVKALEEAGKKPDGTVQMQAVMTPAMNKLIRKKLGVLKHSDQRVEVRENIQLLCDWDDVVNVSEDTGVPATLLDVDSSGFRIIINDPAAELPDVDSLLAINRPGHGVKRGTLIWKRLQARGVTMGGRWLEGEFEQIQLSMLGHSEMSVGVREWHALAQQIDEKHVACWLGEPALQPGISVLLPVGDKKFSSTLDQISHRGGNFCQGVVLVGEEWKEVNFELDL